MKFIKSVPNPSGAYPAAKSMPFPGCLPLTDGQAETLVAYHGWVTLTREPDPEIEGSSVTVTPDLEAWEAWKAAQPPEPEPEPAMAEVISLARMTAQALPDAQALQVPSLYPLWAAGTSYGGTGEALIVRRPNGYLYRCREPHTAQAGWEPETTAALWAAIQGSQAGTPEDPIPAARGMEYQYGLYYLDPEDSQIYLCRRTGEEEGGKVVLQYLPHELVGQYFEVVE